MATSPEKDPFSGIETTGHEWDGIKELNNPLPRWWLWILYACVVWAVGYWIAMPAWPLISSYTKGVLGHSQRVIIAESIEQAKQAQAQWLTRIEAASVADIRADPELLDFALAGGRSAFAVNCSQCHGRGAAGFKGYPNLNDDAWLWGGTVEQIYFTIKHGIRTQDDPDARWSQMPAFGKDGLLEREQIGAVVEYTLAISGQEHDADRAAQGQAVFVEQCAACHLESGTGNIELGAPNLTDAIWLYGGDRQALTDAVVNARFGVMPAWGLKLDDATVKQLAVYVHALGGGQ
ncbi:MAG: cytochrome-c oxidase, cbb3-type subunit III [Alphaproteobacteria bacterium]|nr:cytochrome-c oxidase, cbb3-type subunit III [Alphaproteobacteria bacterium]